jgi:hypothetical protein
MILRLMAPELIWRLTNDNVAVAVNSGRLRACFGQGTDSIFGGQMFRLILAGLTVAVAISAAQANTYDWTFTGSVTGSGSLMTQGSCGTGCETITAIGGTFAGVQIDALLPSGTWPGPTVGSNDNQLFPTSPSYLDFSGVSFSRISASNANIYWDSPLSTYGFCLVDAPSCGVGNTGVFSIAPVVGVPGPIVGAGLPGILFAGGGLLAWWRRKRKNALLTV